MLSVKQSGIKYHFFMTQPGFEPQSPGPLANTLFIKPLDYVQTLFPLKILDNYIKKI